MLNDPHEHAHEGESRETAAMLFGAGAIASKRVLLCRELDRIPCNSIYDGSISETRHEATQSGYFVGGCPNAAT